VQERVGAAEEGAASLGRAAARIPDLLPAEMRLDLASEELPVLDLARQEERSPRATGDLDGLSSPRLGADRSDKQQMVARLLSQRETGQVDPGVNGREVVELRPAVRFAHGDVVHPAVVLGEHGEHRVGRQALDGGHQRPGSHLAEGQRQETEVAVDQVEFVGALEDLGDLQALPDLPIQTAVRLESGGTPGGELRGSRGIPRGEAGDLHAPFGEARDQRRDDALPRLLMAWRDSPRGRREQGDAHLERTAPFDPVYGLNDGDRIHLLPEGAAGISPSGTVECRRAMRHSILPSSSDLRALSQVLL
jgi:hypothetical protein